MNIVLLYQDTQKRDGPKDHPVGSTYTGLNKLISTKSDANYILSNKIWFWLHPSLPCDANFTYYVYPEDSLGHIQDLFNFEHLNGVQESLYHRGV